jgi:organic radical activating enzyme
VGKFIINADTDLALNITRRCNRRCQYCNQPPGNLDIGDLVDTHIERWVPALLQNLAPPGIAISGGEPGTMRWETVQHLMETIYANLDRPTTVTVYTNGLFIKKYRQLLQNYHDTKLILNYRWHVSAEFLPEPMTIAPSLREYLDTIDPGIRRASIHPLVVLHHQNLPHLEGFLASNPEHEFYIDTIVPSRKMFDEGTVQDLELTPEDYVEALAVMRRASNVNPYVIERTEFYTQNSEAGKVAEARRICGQSIKVLSIDLLAERIYRCCDFRDELVDDSVPLSEENIKMRLIQGLFKPNPKACAACHDIIFHYRGELERRKAIAGEPPTIIKNLKMHAWATR